MVNYMYENGMLRLGYVGRTILQIEGSLSPVAQNQLHFGKCSARAWLIRDVVGFGVEAVSQSGHLF